MKHKVMRLKNYADSVFELRMERQGLEFEPGQYVMVRKPGLSEKREYSIYSSPNKDFLELLIKDVNGGDVSGALHQCRIGDELDVEGPFGSFTIPHDKRSGKFIFIATGTGIAPFHSFVTSYPKLDYQILHGVREPAQLYGCDSFDPNRHMECLTGNINGHFNGRVTDYLRRCSVDTKGLYYLCGRSDMIYESFDILQKKGVPRHHLYTEVYL
jgi:ferredoxin-NADP reductase